MTDRNTVSSSFLSHLSDDEIRAQIADLRADGGLARFFPGRAVSDEAIRNLPMAMEEAGADFGVEKRPIFTDLRTDSEGTTAREITTHAATFRTDTGATLGVVGTDYGVVQTNQAFQAADILAARGDLALQSVAVIDGGSRVRVTGLLGETVMPSANGAPNTLGHFAVFEAGHDGNTSVTASVYTLRLECFNGMTSKSVVHTHKLRHTSKASDRMEAHTQQLLANLIGDVEAEVAIFSQLTHRPMDRAAFEEHVTELLGGPLAEDAAKRARTIRDNAMEELLGYFDGGNQGAGETAWGAFQSVTRWLEAKRERMEDSAKSARKFTSNLSGDGAAKRAKSLALLTR